VDNPFPSALHGNWYSFEDGVSVDTSIDHRGMGHLGLFPMEQSQPKGDMHEILFVKPSGCHYCARFLIRSFNLLERQDSMCVTGTSGPSASVASLCNRGLLPLDAPSSIMYRHDATPINCRHSLYGRYHFAWQNTLSFRGECNHPEALLRSCQEPGNQFGIANQQFFMHYHKCPGIRSSFDAKQEFSCLGSWQVGNNQYFAVANTKESRPDEKYKCFVKSREDDLYLGISHTPDCSLVRTPEDSPIRVRLTPAKHEHVTPGCIMPYNMTGNWVSTGKREARVKINETHLLETTWHAYTTRTSAYVCQEKRGNRYLMAKLSIHGCQTEYVCWEFLPRHHNIIRYRKTPEMINNHFEVCDYSQFRSGRKWNYDLLIAETPDPISCPFGGRFRFGQNGPIPLKERILNGVTKNPLDTYQCDRFRTDMKICDAERKWIKIDLKRCRNKNYDGSNMDQNTVTDYRLQCVGYWKENLLSYLITYDPTDSVSNFRCWVYIRMGLTKIHLSQSVGPSCHVNQTHNSHTIEEGASVMLNLTINEKLYDRCPLYYDDGRDPWVRKEGVKHVFKFRNTASQMSNFLNVFAGTALIILLQNT
ncbi:unnamed protein product, partial [Meganyctiphanes norvegica]